jgi:hypothetical protein
VVAALVIVMHVRVVRVATMSVQVVHAVLMIVRHVRKLMLSVELIKFVHALAVVVTIAMPRHVTIIR